MNPNPPNDVTRTSGVLYMPRSTISLKLAQRELMKREFGEEPVLLLDDVLSELDPGRQDFVLNQIDSGQVFITCCEPGRFTKIGKTIEITNGQIKIDN